MLRAGLDTGSWTFGGEPVARLRMSALSMATNQRASISAAAAMSA